MSDPTFNEHLLPCCTIVDISIFYLAETQTDHYDELENKCSSMQPSRYRIPAWKWKGIRKLHDSSACTVFIYANTPSDNIIISIHFAWHNITSSKHETEWKTKHLFHLFFVLLTPAMFYVGSGRMYISPIVDIFYTSDTFSSIKVSCPEESWKIKLRQLCTLLV